MPGISYSLDLDSSGGIAGINAFRGALSGLNGMVGALAPLAGLAGGLGVVGLAVAGFKKSIDEAAKMESFETGFKVLLGSLTNHLPLSGLLPIAVVRIRAGALDAEEVAKNFVTEAGKFDAKVADAQRILERGIDTYDAGPRLLWRDA